MNETVQDSTTASLQPTVIAVAIVTALLILVEQPLRAEPGPDALVLRLREEVRVLRATVVELAASQQQNRKQIEALQGDPGRALTGQKLNVFGEAFEEEYVNRALLPEDSF